MVPYDFKFLRDRVKDLPQVEIPRIPSKYEQMLATRTMNDGYLAGHLRSILATYYAGNIQTANETLAQFLDEARLRIEGQIEAEQEQAHDDAIQAREDDKDGVA